MFLNLRIHFRALVNPSVWPLSIILSDPWVEQQESINVHKLSGCKNNLTACPDGDHNIALLNNIYTANIASESPRKSDRCWKHQLEPDILRVYSGQTLI